MTSPSPPDSAVRVLDLPDEQATTALGVQLGRELQIGDVVLLRGNLGAGKTTLARGLIEGWTGAPEDAPSPTYTLVQVYEAARGPLWHMDLYRLDDPDEAYELVLEDALVEAATVIEWPERLPGFAPADRLEIHLDPAGDGRRATVQGFGRLAGVLDER